MTKTIGKGHNKPPKTPFEELTGGVEDLYEEAKLWLAGGKKSQLTTDGQADSVGNMIKMFRALEKTRTELFKAEKAPFLDAGREVDGKYNPLRDRIELATKTLKGVLGPWQAKKDEELREIQRKEEEKAAALAAAALKAQQEKDTDNLEEVEAAEALTKEAGRAAKVAKKAGKATATVGSTGGGRRIGMKTVWTTELVDPTSAFLLFKNDERVTDALLTCARARVAAGARELDGFKITEGKAAV